MALNLFKLEQEVTQIIEEIGLQGVQANVRVKFDYSGSARPLYEDSTVQDTATRLLAVGLKMSPTRSVEVDIFHDGHQNIGIVTEENYENFVNTFIYGKYQFGGTRYAPTIENTAYGLFPNHIKVAQKQTVEVASKESEKKGGLLSRLFGGKKEDAAEIKVAIKVMPSAADIPTLVFFITDGENQDPSRAEKAIREASYAPIFWQFIGIGREDFEFLKHLDEMEGRYIDNANFFQLDDLNKVDDKELYRRILGEFPDWIQKAKAIGLIK